MALNYLLFMNNLKLFTCNNDSLYKLLSKTKKFFADVRFGLNAYKFARSSDYTEVKTLNELLAVNTTTGYKNSGFFQIGKTLQILNKKKVMELVHKRIAR